MEEDLLLLAMSPNFNEPLLAMEGRGVSSKGLLLAQPTFLFPTGVSSKDDEEVFGA